jgi:hypothetical protein
VKNLKHQVHQLTAIGVILFEFIEGTEGRAADTCNQLTLVTESISEVIKAIVTNAFLSDGTIIPVPRLELDSSYNPDTELEDLRKLEEAAASVAYQLPWPFSEQVEQIALDLSWARISLMEWYRPTIQEPGEKLSPWQLLEPQ